jgi:hypothetical protein
MRVTHEAPEKLLLAGNCNEFKAYGLYLGCSRAPIKHRIGSWTRIQTSHRRPATVSSRMAQSRYGSAGELLAWRPIVRDTKAFKLMGVFRGVTPGL